MRRSPQAEPQAATPQVSEWFRASASRKTCQKGFPETALNRHPARQLDPSAGMVIGSAQTAGRTPRARGQEFSRPLIARPAAADIGDRRHRVPVRRATPQQRRQPNTPSCPSDRSTELARDGRSPGSGTRGQSHVRERGVEPEVPHAQSGEIHRPERERGVPLPSVVSRCLGGVHPGCTSLSLVEPAMTARKANASPRQLSSGRCCPSRD